MRYTKHSKSVSFPLLFGLLAAIITVLSGAVGSYAHAANLSNWSPTPANMYRTGNTSNNDQAMHIILKSDHGQVLRNELAAYYETPGTKTIRLYTQGAQGSNCSVWRGGSHGQPLKPLSQKYVSVRFDRITARNQETDSGGARVYKIRGSRICDQAGNTYRNNSVGDEANQFYANYNVPTSTTRDPETGLYKLKITVRYQSDDGTPNIPRETGNSPNQNINFRVFAQGARIIGNINTGDSRSNDPNNSTVGRTIGTAGTMTQRFTFAKPCGTPATRVWERVTLYDADNGSSMAQGGHTMYFYVLEDGNPLPASRYQNAREATAQNRTIGNRTVRTFTPQTPTSSNPDRGQDARVDIHMKGDSRYTLVVGSVHTRGASGGNNFIYIGTPGDAIFGASNFSCFWRLAPETRMSVNSTTNYNVTNTSANPLPVPVGTVVRWQNRVTNTGNNPSSSFNRRVQRTTASTTDYAYFGNTGTTNNLGAGQSAGWYGGSTRTVTAADAASGRVFCERYWVNRTSSGAPSTAQTSRERCVRATASGDLRPVIELAGDPQTTTQGAPVVTVPKIENSGAAIGSRPWEIVEFRLDSESATPKDSVQGNTQSPCVYFGTPCVGVHGASSPIPTGGLATSSMGSDYERTGVVDVDAPLGARICFALSVSPSAGTWNHSDPVCVPVVKNPKIQVLGGDVRARQTIQTGLHAAHPGGNKADPLSVFGSWTRYGGLSEGRSTGFTSAGVLKDGYAASGVGDARLYTLTFGNPVGEHGGYTLPILSSITRSATQNCGAANSITSNSSFSCDTPLSIGGNTNVTGTVVRTSQDTITITGNIEYSDTQHSNLSQLPQVIIISDKDIIINSNVTRIDAWLISPSGTLRTCNVDFETKAYLDEDDCANRLTINGPVIADKIELLRTAGSDGSKASNGTDPEERLSSPAEVFNLRPDAYLWASTQGAARSYRTTSVVELPPRF